MDQKEMQSNPQQVIDNAPVIEDVKLLTEEEEKQQQYRLAVIRYNKKYYAKNMAKYQERSRLKAAAKRQAQKDALGYCKKCHRVTTEGTKPPSITPYRLQMLMSLKHCPHCDHDVDWLSLVTGGGSPETPSQ